MADESWRRIHSEGDSGCGDNNWPKTFVYLAGWGFGHATLNGKPLYDNYEMHFMVTQGSTWHSLGLWSSEAC